MTVRRVVSLFLLVHSFELHYLRNQPAKTARYTPRTVFTRTRILRIKKRASNYRNWAGDISQGRLQQLVLRPRAKHFPHARFRIKYSSSVPTCAK